MAVLFCWECVFFFFCLKGLHCFTRTAGDCVALSCFTGTMVVLFVFNRFAWTVLLCDNCVVLQLPC